MLKDVCHVSVPITSKGNDLAKAETKICTTSAGAPFSNAMKIFQVPETVLWRVYDVGLMTEANGSLEQHTEFVTQCAVRLMVG